MIKRIVNYLPENDSARKWVSIVLTATVAGLFTVWGIYGFGVYGVALFILIPVFIGAGAPLLYGSKKGLTKSQAWSYAFLTLLIYTVGLLAFAIEGLICIVMALPIILPFTVIGIFIALALHKKRPGQAPTTLVILFVLIPTMGFLEKDNEPELTAVTTSIVIDAPALTVWENVVEFPQLEEPTEWLFKTGIAYPINAEIVGEGVGSVRYCNFTTGSFVEPITVWDAPRLLQFSVEEQPQPMKEISFWDINAPHLHDYFVSKKGQFKLIDLGNGQTRLEGTTWYYHNIRPAVYWRIWSDYIIHQIHQRVLNHIKQNAERQLT